MMVKLKMIALSLLMSGTFVYAQSGLGSVKGAVKDEKTKQAIPLCKVKIVQNGTTKVVHKPILMVNFKLTVFNRGLTM